MMLFSLSIRVWWPSSLFSSSLIKIELKELKHLTPVCQHRVIVVRGKVEYLERTMAVW